MNKKRLNPRMVLTYNKMETNPALFQRIAAYMAAKLSLSANLLGQSFPCEQDALEGMAQDWLQVADYDNRPTLAQLTAQFMAKVTG